MLSAAHCQHKQALKYMVFFGRTCARTAEVTIPGKHGMLSVYFIVRELVIW